MSSLPVTMETMYQIVLLFLAAASVMATSSSPLYIVDFEQIPGPLTNMEVYNDKLYIGGKDKIHVLDMNLDTLTPINTCNGKDSCNNINKVLVIDKNKEVLVACGTGLGGRCDSFNVTSGTYMTAYGENEILQISTDIDRPAQAMIAQEGHLVIAITFGPGITVREKEREDNSQYNTYNYAISRRKMPDLVFISSVSDNKGLNLQIDRSQDYVIHYKSSFQHNGFSYFVTRQKEYVGGDKYVSKLVRLCQNDTKYTAYTDIVIQCKDDEGNTYGIVHKAIITNTIADSNDQMFIGTFSKRDNPSDWVICSIKLEDLDKSIVNAKKEFVSTPKVGEDKKRYLQDARVIGAKLNESDFQKKDFVCSLAYTTFYYVIGTVPAIITAGKKMQQNKGVSTALHATLENDKDLVVMVGTSEGQLILLNYDNSTSKFDEYSVTDVSPGDNIRAIYSTNDEVYILSDNRVHRYSSTNCSEFETCKETIKGRNPLCGWCVFEQKATRKSKCTGSNNQNYWMSSLGDCVKLTVKPAGTKVNTEISITVTASDNIPKSRTGDTYDCVFHGRSFMKSSRASRNGNVFTCRTPSGIF